LHASNFDALLTPAAIEQVHYVANADKARANGANCRRFSRIWDPRLSAGNAAETRSLWGSKKTVFPESSVYMEQLLKRLNAPINKPPHMISS
jgi:hypothetical protein